MFLCSTYAAIRLALKGASRCLPASAQISSTSERRGLLWRHPIDFISVTSSESTSGRDSSSPRPRIVLRAVHRSGAPPTGRSISSGSIPARAYRRPPSTNDPYSRHEPDRDGGGGQALRLARRTLTPLRKSRASSDTSSPSYMWIHRSQVIANR